MDRTRNNEMIIPGNRLWFHDAMEALSFRLRTHILEFFAFPCAGNSKDVHGEFREPGYTRLQFSGTKFFGVNENRWDGDEDNDQEMTSGEIIRYLYGYYEKDPLRNIFLLRNSITLRFRTNSPPTNPVQVANFIPKGTKRLGCELICGHFVNENEPKSFCFEGIPTSVKKLGCTNIGREFWKSISATNHLNSLLSVSLKESEDVTRFRAKFEGLSSADLYLDFAEFSDGSHRNVVFPNMKRLSLHLKYDFTDNAWLTTMFPNLESLRLFPSRKSKSDTEMTPSLFPALKSLKKLRTLELNLWGRLFTAKNLYDLLNENRSLKALHFDYQFKEEFSPGQLELKNSSLEQLTIYLMNYPMTSRAFIETLLQNLELKKLGIRNTLHRSAEMPELTTKAMADLNSFPLLISGEKSGQKGKIISDDVISFFVDEKRTFRLESLDILLPSMKLPTEFFLPKRKWENLKSLELSCKNEGRLLKTFVDENLFHLEHFRFFRKLLPSHTRYISKIPTLRSFASPKLEDEQLSFLKINAKQIQIISSCDHFGSVYHRIAESRPAIIDPLKRFNFGTPGLQRIQKKEKIAPKVAESEKNDEDKEEDYTRVFVCDDADEIPKEEHEGILESYFAHLDKTFWDATTSQPKNLSISAEEYEMLKKSISLSIHPEYYGYKIFSRIRSLADPSIELSFFYDYHNRSRAYSCERFESLRMKLPKRYENCRTPVGYQSIIDLKEHDGWHRTENFVIFQKWEHHENCCSGYNFATEYLLKKIERSIFGRHVFSEFKYLLYFLYLVGATELDFVYGEGDDAESRDWILPFCEVVYDGVRFGNEEMEQESRVEDLFHDEPFYEDPEIQEEEEEERRENERGRGGCGVM